MEFVHFNYKIKTGKRIGRGGFGYVEEVELFTLTGVPCGRPYAIKVLSCRDPQHHEEFKRRFEREVMYQANCAHNNIVNIYLCNLREEKPWFLMDRAESDLQKDMDRGLLDDESKIKIVLMVLDAVVYMHGRGYLHRDIKPSNVLRFPNSVYKISDFGLVKNLDKGAESEVLTQIAVAMGTQNYMAPEIGAGVYSEQTDVYALGVLIDSLNISANAYPAVQKVIDRSTARRPMDRLKSAAALQSAFVAATEESTR